jgi:hypothetical protein
MVAQLELADGAIQDLGEHALHYLPIPEPLELRFSVEFS